MRVGLHTFDMQSTDAPATVIAGPVLSAGGVIVLPPGYFKALKAEAPARGMLLVFNEAQTAFGRPAPGRRPKSWVSLQTS